MIRELSRIGNEDTVNVSRLQKRTEILAIPILAKLAELTLAARQRPQYSSRMRRLLLICIAGFCCAALAQDECRVTTHFGVVHRQGPFVTGLKAEQLRITLHGKAQSTDVKLEERDESNVVVLLDNSGSMADVRPNDMKRHKMALRAATDILKAFPPKTNVRLTVFSDAGVSADGKDASFALLNQTTTPHGRTALWQSVSNAASGMKDGGTIIAITDGADNRSKVGADHLRKQLLADRVRLVVLLFENDSPSTLEEQSAPVDCASLVSAVGGEVLPLRGDGSLTPVAVREMLHSYRLSMTVPKAAAQAKWKLSVETGNRAIDKNVLVEAPKTLPGCDAE